MSTSGLISGLLGGFADTFEQQTRAKEEKTRADRAALIAGKKLVIENSSGLFTDAFVEQNTLELMELLGLDIEGKKGANAQGLAKLVTGLGRGVREAGKGQEPRPTPSAAPEAVTFADLPESPLAGMAQTGQVAQFESRVPGAPTERAIAEGMPVLAPVPTAPSIFKTPEDKANEARAEEKAKIELEVWGERYKTQLERPDVQKAINADVELAARNLGRPPSNLQLQQIIGKHLDIPGFGGPGSIQTLEDETPGAAVLSSDPSGKDAFGQPIEPSAVYKTVLLPGGEGMVHFPKAESPSAAQEKLNLEIEAFRNENPNVTDAGARRAVLGERRKNVKLLTKERIERLKVTRLRNQIQEELRSSGGLSEATARQILFHTRREAEALVDSNFDNIGITPGERVRQIDDAQKKLLMQGYGISRTRILSRLGLTKYKIGQIILHKGVRHKVVGFTDDGNLQLKKVP